MGFPRADENHNKAFHQAFPYIPETEDLTAEYDCFPTEQDGTAVANGSGHLFISERQLYYKANDKTSYFGHTGPAIEFKHIVEINNIHSVSPPHDTVITVKRDGVKFQFYLASRGYLRELILGFRAVKDARDRVLEQQSVQWTDEIVARIKARVAELIGNMPRVSADSGIEYNVPVV